MSITLAITTYNRTTLLFESFEQVINDDRISEIIIVDDCSDNETFQTIAWYCKDIDKIKLYRNEQNLGCYKNKREAISKASNEWVIIWDSDNMMTKGYIDACENSLNNIPALDCTNDIIYQPSFAKPHFDFSKYSGKYITKQNVNQFIDDSTFTTMLNAMNYLVNRDEYLKVWEDRSEPWTADSLLQNYNWLKSGNSIYVVPGLEYEHRVHEGSHYKAHYRKTGNLYNEIIEKLKQLK